jgi:hypothetical protein
MGIEQKIAKLSEKANKLQRIREKFLDLDETRDRWGTIRLTAKSANSQVTDIETRHTCGCCNDAPFMAMPYLEIEGERVYSNPERFCVGEKSTSYYGENWYDDWQVSMQQAGIPQVTIDKLVPAFEKDRKRAEAYDNYQEEVSEID